MQEASFRNIINTLFWIVVLYYALKFLAKLLLPIMAKKVVEKAEQQFRNQHEQYRNPQQSKQDTKTKESKKVGDYIDYEEIE